MNKANILALADAIASSKLARRRSKKDRIGFNMGTFYDKTGLSDDMTGNECGTAACMAGWAFAMFDKRGVPREKPLTPAQMNRVGYGLGIMHNARVALGLSGEQASALFVPRPLHRPLYTITPSKAVATLRKLARTGKVEWAFRNSGGK